jgi:hypothetical protein
VARSLLIALRAEPPDRAHMLRAWPLVLAGGVVYTVGALTTPNGAEPAG